MRIASEAKKRFKKGFLSPLKREFGMLKAQRAATKALNSDGYQTPLNYEKFIELADIRFKVTEQSDMNLAQQQKAQSVVGSVIQALQADDQIAAIRGLESLSQYFGYPDASRNGGVTKEIRQAMIEHNANAEKAGEHSGSTVIPQAVIDRVEQLIEEQATWQNQERYNRQVAALTSLHTKYPGDFLNSLHSAEPAERAGMYDWIPS